MFLYVKYPTIFNISQDHLSTKTRAAAWFVSNCNTESLRESFVNSLQQHLRNFNMEVDIYGDCGTLQCPKSIMSRCLAMIGHKYFFYFAFENSISEDYVTEKVLYALKHNAVPVVLGGANYTRYYGLYSCKKLSSLFSLFVFVYIT